MQRLRKQKKQREFKQQMISVQGLTPTLTHTQQDLLSKIYPQIGQLNSLRIMTIIEIIYLLQISLDAVDKSAPDYLKQFKIGIIGGGVTSRVLLNSILALSRDGLQLSNITLSTRQTQNFQAYVHNFGIKVVFDNQLVAKEADFLVVATPATLDNWIINDIRKVLVQRLKQQQIVGKPVPPASMQIKGISELKQDSSIDKISDKKKTIKKRPFKPLVYIMTSDFNEEKCKKLFPFPVLTPSARAIHINQIKKYFKMIDTQDSQIYQHLNVLTMWLLHKKQIQEKRLQTNQNQLDKSAAWAQYFDTPFFNILKAVSFVLGSSRQTQVSIGSSASNSVSLSEHARERTGEDSMSEAWQLLTGHGDVGQTLMKKCRKWKMAHHNFTA